MKLTVAGCGDAFGTDGRFNTCFHVVSEKSTFLIDCGASSLIALKKWQLDPGEIDHIYITHLHGDHFGGLAWFLIDAQFRKKRTNPLKIVGPEGLEDRFTTVTEALFEGATHFPREFELSFESFEEQQVLQIPGGTVTPYEVLHASGAPPFALRFEVDGRILAFTGDTEWVEHLVPAGKDADLFITECYQFDIKAKMHLDYQTIAGNMPRINARKVLLTHMGEAMLEQRGAIDQSLYVAAEDGMILEI